MALDGGLGARLAGDPPPSLECGQSLRLHRHAQQVHEKVISGHTELRRQLLQQWVDVYDTREGREKASTPLFTSLLVIG